MFYIWKNRRFSLKLSCSSVGTLHTDSCIHSKTYHMKYYGVTIKVTLTHNKREINSLQIHRNKCPISSTDCRVGIFIDFDSKFGSQFYWSSSLINKHTSFISFGLVEHFPYPRECSQYLTAELLFS